MSNSHRRRLRRLIASTFFFPTVLVLHTAVIAVACKGADGGSIPISGVDLSPGSWPGGELERYTAENNRNGADYKVEVGYDIPPPAGQGRRGMVIGSTDALAVRAGVEALKQGGSAMDAALTTALGQASLAASGAGMTFAGWMTLMYYDASTGTVHTLNSGFNVPLAEDNPQSIPRYGSHSGRCALVPGFIAGVDAAHRRFGRLPFHEIFSPAIYFAEHGVPLSPMIEANVADRTDMFMSRPEALMKFIRSDGQPYRVGDIFPQPELAETLRRVANQGAQYMYSGLWAQRFVKAISENGGIITLRDLARYEPQWDKPIRTQYRDYEILAMDPPNFGSSYLIEAANLLDLADIANRKHYTGDPETLYWLTQISRVAELAGPGVGGTWTSDDYIRRIFPNLVFSMQRRITKEHARDVWAAMQTEEWMTLMEHIYPSTGNADSRIADRPQKSAPSRHSASVVAVDEAGNVVTLVHTLNSLSFGNGIVVDGVYIPDSGCFQQEIIARTGAGGRQPDPTTLFIALKDGKPVLASSTTGGLGVLRATLEGLSNVLDFGMDPYSAAETQHFMRADWRMTPYHEAWRSKGQFSEADLEAARAMGETLGLSDVDGYWVSIRLDPETRELQGSAPRIFNGFALGF